MTKIAIASVLLFLAVIMGAFGAHILAPRLEALGRTSVWETAVFYHIIHGLAIFTIGVWETTAPEIARMRLISMASGFWVAGVLLFSGSLYVLSLGGPGWLGPITPLGGVCFLVGWLALAVVAVRIGRKDSSGA